jgi:hypothetical protein
MRPVSVVLMYRNSELSHYGLFYSRKKAERAFQHALRAGTLQTEDGGFSHTWPPEQPRLVYIGKRISTEMEPQRTNLVNLHPEELRELSERFVVPSAVIAAIAGAERDTLERKRYPASKCNERTKALMRKYLPRVVLKWSYHSTSAPCHHAGPFG